MYDYKLLQALTMVVQEGGFERAARALHLTQSAVSQRIKLLEEELGQVLIIRSTPPQATPAGAALIRHCRQVSLLERGLAEELSLEGPEGRTSLRLAVNTDSLSTWFIPAVSDFLAEEDVLLDLRVLDEEMTHRLLRDGEVVGCISARAKAMQGCRVEPLGGIRYRLLATPDFAARWFPEGLSREGVGRAPLLAFTRDDLLHLRVLRAVLGRRLPPLPRHYVPSQEQLLTLVSQGLAYGMVPDFQSRELRAAGALLELAPGQHPVVQLHWHCWNLDSPLLRRFTQHLTEGAQELLAVMA